MIVYNSAGGQKITDDGQRVTDDGQKITEPQKVTEAPVGDCECGLEHKKSPPADSNRIVGGMNVTNENAHPWTVSLNYNLSRLAGYMIGYKGFYDEKRIFHVLEERLENLKIPLPSNVACGGTLEYRLHGVIQDVVFTHQPHFSCSFLSLICLSTNQNIQLIHSLLIRIEWTTGNGILMSSSHWPIYNKFPPAYHNLF